MIGSEENSYEEWFYWQFYLYCSIKKDLKGTIQFTMFLDVQYELEPQINSPPLSMSSTCGTPLRGAKYNIIRLFYRKIHQF